MNEGASPRFSVFRRGTPRSFSEAAVKIAFVIKTDGFGNFPDGKRTVLQQFKRVSDADIRHKSGKGMTRILFDDPLDMSSAVAKPPADFVQRDRAEIFFYIKEYFVDIHGSLMRRGILNIGYMLLQEMNAEPFKFDVRHPRRIRIHIPKLHEQVVNMRLQGLVFRRLYKNMFILQFIEYHVGEESGKHIIMY